MSWFVMLRVTVLRTSVTFDMFLVSTLSFVLRSAFRSPLLDCESLFIVIRYVHGMCCVGKPLNVLTFCRSCLLLYSFFTKKTTSLLSTRRPGQYRFSEEYPPKIRQGHDDLQWDSSKKESHRRSDSRCSCNFEGGREAHPSE